MPCIRRFTHVDPFEDTESCCERMVSNRATPVSPTSIRSRILKVGLEREIINAAIVSPTSIRSRILKVGTIVMVALPLLSFTHVDPFEDTESPWNQTVRLASWHVSPTSIRSRILKAPGTLILARKTFGVSPTSIRSRILKGALFVEAAAQTMSFTHVDPFEDTERASFTRRTSRTPGFTHVDPFEDTESAKLQAARLRLVKFHPRRSVRGY